MIFGGACPEGVITTKFAALEDIHILIPARGPLGLLISPSPRPISPNRGMLRVLAHMTYRGNSTHFQRTIAHHIHIYLPRRAIPLARWPCSNHREGLVPHGRRLLLTPFSVPGEPAGSTFGPLEIVRAEKLSPSTPVLGRCERGRSRKVREEGRVARHSPGFYTTPAEQPQTRSLAPRSQRDHKLPSPTTPAAHRNTRPPTSRRRSAAVRFPSVSRD